MDFMHHPSGVSILCVGPSDYSHLPLTEPIRWTDSCDEDGRGVGKNEGGRASEICNNNNSPAPQDS